MYTKSSARLIPTRDELKQFGGGRSNTRRLHKAIFQQLAMMTLRFYERKKNYLSKRKYD